MCDYETVPVPELPNQGSKSLSTAEQEYLSTLKAIALKIDTDKANRADPWATVRYIDTLVSNALEQGW